MAHPTKEHHIWLDITKGLAILWIFLVHFYERFGDAPLFANPQSNWPPISERIAQLLPLDVNGLSGIFINLLRYVGWLGDQGVQIFLVASGFGLVLSYLKNNSAFSVKSFYYRRLVRLFPLWIAAHLIFILTYIFLNMGLSPADWQTWASILGLRFIPTVMFYQFPAWWFIGLILQLYIIFPWLFMILQRWSPIRFFLIIGGAAILIRLVGLLLFNQFGHGLGLWSIGGCFLSRLPEFTFGMAFAKWMVNNASIKVEGLNKSVCITCLLCIYILGNVYSFFLLGMSVALLLTGVSFFLLIFVLLSERELQEKGMFARIGRNSYGIYLVHHPIIIFLVPSDLSLAAGSKILAYLITSMILSLILGQFLEKGSNQLFTFYKRWKTKNAKLSKAAIWMLILGIISSFFVGVETFIRKVDPQEVLGWGERPSLEPHATYGYSLKPNKTTRLRWMSYDYIVEANAFGFPGPLYDEKKPSSVYRIMVTGDAFESAEGVDTKDSWPRLLEKKLNSGDGMEAQVLNFSITGWGPNQYSSVISDYAPKYNPDLIIVGFFVNEFFDVTIDNDKFRKSIGFQRPSQSGLISYICLINSLKWFKINVVDELNEVIRNRPNPSGYFFGYFQAFEKKNYSKMAANAVLVENQLKSITQTAKDVQAQLLIVLVPSAVQVCEPSTLNYYPKGLDLSDTDRFDFNQPQYLAKKMCEKLDIPFIDLRETLRQVAHKMPYQSSNMHWTEIGHDVVARCVAQYISDSYYKLSGN